MIRAGAYTVEDKGFTVSTETISGVARQIISLELPAGISDKELAALRTGPIEVLGADGESVVQSHTGPFRVVSHGVKLTRTSEDSDVAALSARVSELETALSEEQSAKESAQNQLASLSEQLKELQQSVADSNQDHAQNATDEAETGHAEDSVQ